MVNSKQKSKNNYCIKNLFKGENNKQRKLFNIPLAVCFRLLQKVIKKH